MKNHSRLPVGLAAAALAALLATPLPAHAAPMKGKTHTAAASGVYVCKQCKEYWSAAAAKKMNYKDSMGHKLAKMSKAPAGYADGSKPGAM